MKHQNATGPLRRQHVARAKTRERRRLAIAFGALAVAALFVVALVKPAWHGGAAGGSWSVGQLRPDGLRIVVTGRSDAGHVLDPNEFARADVRHAYWVATQIPALLNQLYCWCGCENRGVHRSNLQCFEDTMGADCDVCVGTAEIAYRMSQQGITDAAKIQAAVDAEWQKG